MPASVNGAAAAAAARVVAWPWLRRMLVGLGISVVPLDTAVNIAFPDITGSFGLPIPMIQWVVICYVLTHAGLMLAFGRVGDMWSHGRVFRAGLLWSVVAYWLCAAAPSFGWLLFFRFVPGIAAGLIISCAPALVTSLYPEARRSHALGVFTLMFALGSAVGPLIGGALVARWGWPGVFWFRAPIALTALVLLHGLPAASGGRGERFDVAGALLLASGLVALLLAINAVPRLRNGDYLVGRIAAERIAPLGALVTGVGLFLIGEWQPDTPPQFMLFALALQGLGMGLFQVAYMEIVMAASPLAYRGVAGSLSMLTRTIGVVTAAAGLTLAFQALQGAASAQGAGEAQAFLSAFRNLFH